MSREEPEGPEPEAAAGESPFPVELGGDEPPGEELDRYHLHFWSENGEKKERGDATAPRQCREGGHAFSTLIRGQFSINGTGRAVTGHSLSLSRW